MEKKYLLFGGSGFIGHHLANLIFEREQLKPVIFDLVNPTTSNALFERIDVKNVIETTCKPANNSILFNLAAVHRTPGHPSDEYFETNLLGAKNVCDYARKHNISTIVFTSSIATYGTYEAQKNENSIPMPDIPYGISKLSAEYIHKLWQKEAPKTRRLIIVRPGVVFGENEKGNFTRLINSISKRRFFYPGRNDTIKACIYVKDLVDIMFNMVEKENVGSCTYSMTYEPAPTIEHICKAISDKGNLPRPRIILPSFLLLLIGKLVYGVTKKESIHPERIKKLMISNNISGVRVNRVYKMKYGLENGIADWMKETNFISEKTIY